MLVHLNQAGGIFILGSTEPHYTPSKSYQGVLSGKPILAVLHSNSTAVNVLRDSGTGLVLDFDGPADLDHIVECFSDEFKIYLLFARKFNAKNINKQLFDNYSAKEITRRLTKLLNRVMAKK